MVRQVVRQYEIGILPDRKILVEEGSSYPDVLARAGFTVDAPCGGQGTCGKCRARFVEGAPPPTVADRDHFLPAELAAGWRLLCQHWVRGPAVLEVHSAEHLSWKQQMAAGETGSELAAKFVPAVRRVVVRLGKPTRERPLSDVARVREALPVRLRHARVSLDFLRALPQLPRSEAEVELTLVGDEIVTWRPLPADRPSLTTPAATTGVTHGSSRVASRPIWGLALDIGTTSLAAALIDLDSGRTVAVEAETNPQVRFGADIMSRIAYARTRPEGTQELHEAVRQGVEALLQRLLAKARSGAHGDTAGDILDVAVVGNSVMEHLFLGISPANLGVSPFVAATHDPVVLDGATARQELGLLVHPRARVFVFPTVAGFVGGDTVGVALAAGFPASLRATTAAGRAPAGDPAADTAGRPGNVLAIDLGTNTEIILATATGELYCCSAPAGPAFEGAEINQGMRATTGAIRSVRVHGDCWPGANPPGKTSWLEIEVIGGTDVSEARGICGSGLVDAVAELLRTGALRPDGRLSLPGGENLVRLGPVALSQADLRQFQLAKAAVATGVTILLGLAGLTPAELDRVLVAGTFGNYLDRNSALRVGLIPPVPAPKVQFVGNAALEGARLVLLHDALHHEAVRLARRMKHVELSLHPSFQEVYVSSTMLGPAQEVGKPGVE